MSPVRAFIESIPWTYATTYSKFAEHTYATRWDARRLGLEEEFTAFAATIQNEGYDRRWGKHLWKSLDLDDGMTYWLYWRFEPPEARTIVNRWHTAEMAKPPAQLSLELDP